MDARNNFAFGTLETGIAADEVTLTLGTDEGARFPAVPFNAVIWNRSTYISPAHAFHDDQAEIVRVTDITGDILTITRAQESTTAVDLNVSGKVYEIWAGPTKGLFDDLELSLNTSSDGSPEGVVDGNIGRHCLDYTNHFDYVKTTAAGDLTGWQILAGY